MLHAATSAMLLILASELGDRTFLLTALLSASSPASLAAIFGGALMALSVVSAVSVVMGRGIVWMGVGGAVERLVVIGGGAVLTLVGVLAIRDVIKGRALENEVESEVDSNEAITASSTLSIATKAALLIFTAEWGDRSQLALIALSATEADSLAVLLGAIVGHGISTAVACRFGGLVQHYFSVQASKWDN